MAYLGLISVDIPDAVVQQVIDKAAEIAVLLKPFYKELSKKQITEFIKLGSEMEPFVNDCLLEIKQNDGFLPKYADMVETTNDKVTYDKAGKMQNPLSTLVGNLENIRKASGSDVLVICLAYYKAVQQGAKLGQADARAIYERLKKHFESRGNKGAKPAIP